MIQEIQQSPAPEFEIAGSSAIPTIEEIALLTPRKDRRTLKLVIAACAWFAIILQLTVSFPAFLSQGYTWDAALLKPFTFLTMTTNLLVAVFYTGRLFPRAKFLNRSEIWASIEGGLVANILYVAIAYQVLSLRFVRSITGLETISDAFLHYIIPLLVLLHWLIFRERNRLNFSHPLYWVVYLAIYQFAMLGYGHLWKTYPYPAVNAAKIGYPQLALNSLFLLIFRAVIAYGVVAFDRLNLSKRPANTGRPV